MKFYVISYDIPDHKRRKKIADLLEGYGTRVQYSVFECVLAPHQYQELKRRLTKVFRKGEDSLRFYPIPSQTLTQAEVWGAPPLTSAPNSVIV
jgi:CRISPR-associated protein Cas2